MMLALLLAIGMWLAVLAVPVFLGVFVYRDAKKRGMQPWLWVAVTLLVPSLLGFVIYLVVRGNYSSMRCAGCGESVQTGWAVCPQCGAKLRACCENCGAPVQPGWKMCAQCGAPVPENAAAYTAVVEDNGADGMMRKGLIVAAVVLGVFVLLVLTLLGLSVAG